jgi:hypothetical protein
LFVRKVGGAAEQEAHNRLVTLASCTVQDGQLVLVLKTIQGCKNPVTPSLSMNDKFYFNGNFGPVQLALNVGASKVVVS